MKTIVRVALTLCLGVSFYANAETAEELVSTCRGIAVAPVQGDEVDDLPQRFSDGVCWGAFTIIQEAIRYKRRNDALPFFLVCAPPKSTRTQLVAIFTKYAEKNPERRHLDAFTVALEALRKSFSCTPTRQRRQ